VANNGREHIQTLVIGGGQSGLTVGYHLAQRGLPFLILDASARVGDAWRNRWDSLRLFTPAFYDGLPGLRFPARGDTFPTKDQMADYLESYASHFNLPVRSGIKVDRLWREGSYFVATAGDRRFECENVVVAMGSFQKPRVPAFGAELKPSIVQVHSLDYRNPRQLRDGGVLIVGVGNSGADIAIEVARTHRTWLAGKETGHLPFRIEKFIARHIGVRVFRFFGHYVLSRGTPIGRRLIPKMEAHAAPLIRVKPQDLVAAGIERVGRIVGTKDGCPLLDDGRVLDEVANVVWCTGFSTGFSWIDMPVFDGRGELIHDRGLSPVPGLYFVGLNFLYSLSSDAINGMPRDAKRAVDAVAARLERATAWQGAAMPQARSMART
jgi:putative flavoprotein involved in K+ transport